MNNLDLSTDNGLMSVNLQPSMLDTPSVSPYLPEEDSSTYLLLPATPSPPTMDFIHPLTPSPGNEADQMTGDDARAETSSSSGSSGIGMMDVTVAGTTTLYNNKNVYQNLDNNGESIQQNGGKQYANLNIQITKDTPSFVHWNWPLIRKCTFLVFMAGIFAMAAIVVAMIATLPRACNPKNVWYKGAVFYEIFPASYQDSNNDGLGDLAGLTNRLDYLHSLGVAAIRLNSVFPSKNYPDHFQNVTTLLQIDEVLGGTHELGVLVKAVHARNMTLVMDLPIYPLLTELGEAEGRWNVTGSTTAGGDEYVGEDKVLASRSKRYADNVVMHAMKLWLSLGVDGFYVKGLENYQSDPNLLANLQDWQLLLGKDRVLIVSEKVINGLDESTQKQILQSVDLVDVYIDYRLGSEHVSNLINDTVFGVLSPGSETAQVHWSLGGVTERRLATQVTPEAMLSATMMTLLLPGSANIFYGDEIGLQESNDPEGDHADTKHLHHLSTMAWMSDKKFTDRNHLPWVPMGATQHFDFIDHITDLIRLRKRSPTIYQNGVCKKDHMEPNTSIKYSSDDVLVVERWYPRRQTFVAICNFKPQQLTLDLSSKFYGGEVVVGRYKSERVIFKEFEIGGVETKVIRLDK